MGVPFLGMGRPRNVGHTSSNLDSKKKAIKEGFQLAAQLLQTIETTISILKEESLTEAGKELVGGIKLLGTRISQLKHTADIEKTRDERLQHDKKQLEEALKSIEDHIRKLESATKALIEDIGRDDRIIVWGEGHPLSDLAIELKALEDQIKKVIADIDSKSVERAFIDNFRIQLAEDPAKKINECLKTAQAVKNHKLLISQHIKRENQKVKDLEDHTKVFKKAIEENPALQKIKEIQSFIPYLEKVFDYIKSIEGKVAAVDTELQTYQQQVDNLEGLFNSLKSSYISVVNDIKKARNQSDKTKSKTHLEDVITRLTKQGEGIDAFVVGVAKVTQGITGELKKLFDDVAQLQQTLAAIDDGVKKAIKYIDESKQATTHIIF